MKKVEAKIDNKTLISLHIVVMLLGLAVWIVRLSDKVDLHDKELQLVQDVDRRLYRIEIRMGIRASENSQ